MWIWNAGEKNYFRFGGITLKVVWKGTRGGCRKWDIDDPGGYWTWDGAVRTYFRFDTFAMEIIWKEAGPAVETEAGAAMSDVPMDDLRRRR